MELRDGVRVNEEFSILEVADTSGEELRVMSRAEIERWVAKQKLPRTPVNWLREGF